jgi:hypothetical protein
MHAKTHRPTISSGGGCGYDNAEEDTSQPRFLDREDGHIIATGVVGCKPGG